MSTAATRRIGHGPEVGQSRIITTTADMGDIGIWMDDDMSGDELPATGPNSWPLVYAGAVPARP